MGVWLERRGGQKISGGSGVFSPDPPKLYLSNFRRKQKGDEQLQSMSPPPPFKCQTCCLLHLHKFTWTGMSNFWSLHSSVCVCVCVIKKFDHILDKQTQNSPTSRRAKLCKNTQLPQTSIHISSCKNFFLIQHKNLLFSIIHTHFSKYSHQIINSKLYFIKY